MASSQFFSDTDSHECLTIEDKRWGISALEPSLLFNGMQSLQSSQEIESDFLSNIIRKDEGNGI